MGGVAHLKVGLMKAAIYFNIRVSIGTVSKNAEKKCLTHISQSNGGK
jgi:hypothetical protein